ncbi:MAG: dodecin family protein [Gemmatimonadales bacterium]
MSSLAKVIEVIGQSDKSFDDATEQAVREAAKTVRGLRSIWIDNFSAEIRNDKIVEYRVNAKLTFVLESHK